MLNMRTFELGVSGEIGILVSILTLTVQETLNTYHLICRPVSSSFLLKRGEFGRGLVNLK